MAISTTAAKITNNVATNKIGRAAAMEKRIIPPATHFKNRSKNESYSLESWFSLPRRAVFFPRSNQYPNTGVTVSDTTRLERIETI